MIHLENLPLTGAKQSFKANIQVIEPLREAWEIFLKEMALKEDEVVAWRLPFTEAVVNAIVHGAKEDPNVDITVVWWKEGADICLEILSPPPGPPDSLVKDPALPEDPLDDHGRGLFLIHHFCDDWEHWRHPQFYRQVLKKNYPHLKHQVAMDPLLEQAINEISLCYESLSAFYKLGDALIHSTLVGPFIQNALKDLKPLVQAKNIHMVFFQKSMEEALYEDLNCITPFREKLLQDSPQLNAIQASGSEFIWEKAEEITSDLFLKNWSSGWAYPLKNNQKVFGLIWAGKKSLPYFNAAQLNTLRTFADLFSIAIAQANHAIARQSEQQALRELEIAAELQEKLFPVPSLPQSPFWELFVRRIPARQVGGDYVDAIALGPQKLLLVMIDVMGKGVSAAFLAAIIRTCLHMNVDMGQPFEQLANRINNLLCSQLGDLTMFATCALCQIDCAQGVVEIVNAGHCPVVLQKKTKKNLECIEPSGPPLGLFKDQMYAVSRHPITPGDELLLLTDGLYEWPMQGLPWSWEAWMRFIQEDTRKNQPERIWNDLQHAIRTQSDQQEATDDQTFCAWRFQSPTLN
jgi:serine phosphatase RsbU (regulator of sigma subunit)/anti-sigma regulatory factor (Ser/Thr protein kinase)